MTRRAESSSEQSRPSSQDRTLAVERLDVALREGRLDLVGYDERVRAAEAATTHETLATQLADLPDRPGVRDWLPHLRVRAGDRHQAVVWLADALTEGSLGDEEHERRLAAATAAVRYDQLREALDGVPGPPATERGQLLVTAADRQALTARLDRALAEGRLGADDHAGFAARLAGARRYRALDDLTADLAGATRFDLREQAVRRLDAALAHGQLDAAEHAQRVAAVRESRRNAEVAPLLADLSPSPEAALRWVLRDARPQLATRRLTDTDRWQACLLVEGALHDGRLSLDEYDERTRLVGQAKVGSQLRPLLIDLVAAGSPAPPPPRAGRLAPGRGSGRRRPVLVFAVALLAIGAFGTWLHVRDGRPAGTGAAATATPTRSPDLIQAWAALPDQAAHSEAIGAWFTGTAVIRARVDRIVAYDAATGQQQWIFQPPDGQSVCAMSRDTGGGVGLVGYGYQRPPTGCATVAAIDLGTGAPLWHHERVLPEVGYRHTRPDLPQIGYLDVDPSVDEVAVAADVAVIREANAFVALGLRGDGQRWRSTAQAGCWPYSATGAGDDLVLITECGQGSWQLSRVDTRSGQPTMRADLGKVRDEGSWNMMSRGLVVVALRPLVVRHPGDDSTSGRGTFVAFDDKGQRRATIPLAQPDGCDLDIADFPGSGGGVRRFANLPFRRLAVAGDTLVTPCRTSDDFTIADRTVAFALDDGRRLWQVKVPGQTHGIGFGAGRLFVVSHDASMANDLTIFTLSVDTGRTVATEPVAAESVTQSSTHLYAPVGDQYLVSSDDTLSATSQERPAVLLRHG